jgi:hypothetical protein
MKLDDGSVINLKTGKPIYQSPLAMAGSDNSPLQAPTIPSSSGPAQASAPSKTAMDKAIAQAKIDPIFASSKIGKAALAQEKENQATKGGGLNDQAVEDLARQYMMTGKMPAMGVGKDSADARKAVLNKYSELMRSDAKTPEEQLAKQEAFKAASHSLSNLQKQKDSILSFANTADKNLDLADRLSDKVIRSNSPFFNKYLLSGRKDFLGDPDVAALHSGVQTAVNEYAKVVSGNGGSSDAARAHAEAMLNEAQTPQQFKAVIKVLKEEVQNRREGYNDQIKTLTQTLSGNPVSGVDHTELSVPKGMKKQINRKTGEVRFIPE